MSNQPTTGFTIDGLIALEVAMQTGARSANIDGRNVSFRDLNEMIRLRGIIRRALGLDPRRGATLLSAHSKGINQVAWDTTFNPTGRS